jgi:hypothetical protein
MLFPMIIAEWLHLVLYFNSGYHNSRHCNSVLEIFVDIRSEAWLNIFWEYINGKCLQCILVKCVHISHLSMLNKRYCTVANVKAFSTPKIIPLE